MAIAGRLSNRSFCLVCVPTILADELKRVEENSAISNGRSFEVPVRKLFCWGIQFQLHLSLCSIQTKLSSSFVDIWFIKT